MMEASLQVGACGSALPVSCCTTLQRPTPSSQSSRWPCGTLQEVDRSTGQGLLGVEKQKLTNQGFDSNAKSAQRHICSVAATFNVACSTMATLHD